MCGSRISSAAFWAMAFFSWSRIAGVGNCASNNGLDPKAAMWISAMREASDSVANVGSNAMTTRKIEGFCSGRVV